VQTPPNQTTAPTAPDAADDAPAATEPAASEDASDSECSPDNEVQIVTNGDGRNLNPILAPDTDSKWRTDLLYDPLVMIDPESLLPIPWLAESWEISDDNKTYTFKLREGVMFHDGEPLTAEDTAFTAASILSPGYQGPFQSDWLRLEGAQEYLDGAADTVAGMEVIDDHTISFTLSEPHAGMLAVMARDLKTMPKHLIEDQGDLTESSEISLNPVGSGQYIFESREAGNNFIAVANPDHWGGEPCMKRIVHTVIPDMNTLIAGIEAGEFDATIVPPPSAADRLRENSDLVLYELPSRTPEGLIFNTERAPFDDVRVRQAIAHAVDFATFGQEFMGYDEAVFATFFSPASWAFTDEYAPPAYDPEEAARLLEEAGYPGGEGLTIELRTNAGNQYREQLLTYVQSQLAAIGVEAVIVAEEWGQHIAAVSGGEFDVAAMNSANNAAVPDPTTVEEAYRTGGAANHSGYSNAEVDALFDQAAAITDVEERTALYHEVLRILSEEIPFMPGYWYPNSFVVSADLENVAPSVVGAYWNIADWNRSS
jgi:peptide/nickel transport system substrate-binding protein